MNEFKVSGTVESIGSTIYRPRCVLHLSVSEEDYCCLTMGAEDGLSLEKIKVGDKVNATGFFKGNQLIIKTIRLAK